MWVGRNKRREHPEHVRRSNLESAHQLCSSAGGATAGHIGLAGGVGAAEYGCCQGRDTPGGWAMATVMLLYAVG